MSREDCFSPQPRLIENNGERLHEGERATQLLEGGPVAFACQ